MYMSPYLKYIKYLYWQWRDYRVEGEFAGYVCGKTLGELPKWFSFIFNIGRGFTMYNARNFLYRCNEPEIKRFRKYIERVELAVALDTCNMRDWRGVVDAIMRTAYEEWKYARPTINVGRRNNIPLVALEPQTLQPLAVFQSRQEAIGVICNDSVVNAEKFGSTVGGAKWQKHADFLAGKPIVQEQRPQDKSFEVNPFLFGVQSLV